MKVKKIQDLAAGTGVSTGFDIKSNVVEKHSIFSEKEIEYLWERASFFLNKNFEPYNPDDFLSYIQSDDFKNLLENRDYE